MLMAILVSFLAACDKDDNSTQPDDKDEALKLMVFSDFHFMHPDLLINDGKAFEEYNAEECKLLIESKYLLDAAIARIKAERPAVVIVCGDMTKDGEQIGHEYVAEVFGRLEKETGAKVLVVPGNHDISNPKSFYYDGDKVLRAKSISETEFARIYAACGYEKAVERRGTSLDYMAYPAENIAFIGVDSNEKNTSEKLMVSGGLTEEQVEWITKMARKAHADGRYVLMSMHHNLVDFYDNAQMIRGDDIANAKYEYDNAELIDDLCAAGIDIVFSGHSHMHSITSATRSSHTIYSVVTSSLVNLPLAYRSVTIDHDGKLTIASDNLQNCKIPGVADLKAEGDKHWRNLSAYYMKTAADKAWGAAEGILKYSLGFEDRDELEAFLKERFEGVFYTFLTRTSEGNEHLYTPQENYEAADKSIEGLLEFFDEKGITESLDTVLNLIFGTSLDEVHSTFSAFFHSAYFNNLGNDPVMPDDALEIQLTNQ